MELLAFLMFGFAVGFIGKTILPQCSGLVWVIVAGVASYWLCVSVPGCSGFEAEKRSLQFQVNAGAYPTPDQVKTYGLRVPGNNPYWRIPQN